ncbi:MAG: hypothetical protein H6625_03155 [Bdellovibrionaceae bacterium]|nr:hypothetical protein [Pseudobdellovibrionaceae bacterium]
MKKYFNNLLLIFLSLQLLVSCKEGKLNRPPDPEPIQILSLLVNDYTQSNVYIHVTGTIQLEDVIDLDTLQFFESSNCSSNIVGSVLVKNFKNTGVDLELTKNNTQNLYVSTENSSDCIFFITYKAEDLIPSEAKFSKTAPESPTRETASPGIFGTAFPSSATIKFYDNSLCTNLVGQGSVTNYSTVGLQINLTSNQVSNVFATVTDLLGQTSKCAELTTYSHLDNVITNPVFTAAIPLSPNNTSSSPFIKGALAPESISVTIYNDSACSNPLVSGTPEEFSNPGLQVILGNNTTTNLYAKSIDDLGNPSACALLTTYVHDTLPPNPPVFTAINPISPNNNNLFPRLNGTTSSDTLTVKFFDSSLCLVQIGSGSKSTFEGVGVSAGVANNSTTDIYAQSLDPAGNPSVCTLMSSYKHNTIPPNFPVFVGSTPSSPDNSTANPMVFGTVASFTNSLEFFDDENCTQSVGAGTSAEFESTGIVVNLQENTNNSVYVKVSDLEGNVSSCVFHTSYDHSNIPAPNPSLLYSFPASPTNGSNMPFFVGITDPNHETIVLYDDNTCANALGSGSRGQFASAGIQVTLPTNSTTNIHAIAQDIYGNFSSCGLLTTFIHNTVNPNNPIFSATVPVSPNATSTTPLMQGSASTPVSSQLPPFKVSFYDSVSCVNKIGEGNPSVFSGAGIPVNTSSDAITSIYAKTFDEAGNSSLCTYLLNYIHDSYQPSKPIFTNANPNSPSYSQEFKMSGVFAASPDFLNRVSVGVYTDSACANLLTSGSPTDYISGGISVTVPNNVTTPLYAATVNELGTRSNCQFQVNFKHDDVSPQSLSVSNNLDGGVYLNWQPDLDSSPLPKYFIERSLSVSGPFSLIASNLNANNFTDDLVSEGQTYFYRVFASNSTGRSRYSSVENTTVSVGSPVVATTLTANPGSQEVRLTWGANISNMTYKIYRSTQSGGPYTLLPITTTNNLYLDNTVSNNMTYYYVVTGSNPSGESMQSNMAAASTRPLPAAPTNLKMQAYPEHPDCAGTQGLQLTWNPSSYYDSFGVMRGNNSGIVNLDQATNENKFLYCNLNDGYSYSFAISSQWGTKYSANSSLVYYYWTSPANLSLAPGENEIILNWTEPNGGVLYNNSSPKYNVFRSTSINGPFTEILSDFTARSYTDNTITPGVTYFYYIQTVLTTPQNNYYYIGPRSLVRSGTAGSLPAAPTNLVLIDNTSLGSVELHWSAPSHYNSFNLYQASSFGGPYTWAGKTSNSRILGAPLNPGMNYFYVKAIWGLQETAATNIVSYRKADITGFNVTPTASDITLTWDSVSGAQDYKILRADNANGPYSEIATEITNSHVDTSVISNTGYFYRVYATFSDATVGQKSAVAPAMLTGPTTPTGVSLKVTSSTSVNVSWAPVLGATAHKIYSATSFGGPYIFKVQIPLGSESVVAGLTANTEYFFKVSALVSSTEYDSTPVSVYTYSIPATPLGIVGNNYINVSWTPVIGVVDYDLLRSSDGENYTPLISNHPTSSYLDNSASNGQIYFYKLRANFAMGSSLSLASIAYTPGVTPIPPVYLVAKNTGTGTDLQLDWGKVEGASSYKVYVDTTASHVTPFISTSSNQNVLISGLNLGTTYFISVSASNGDLESSLTPDVKIVTSIESVAPDVQKNGLASVDVIWPAVTNATTYEIYRSQDGVSFESIANGIGATVYNDTTVDLNTTYFYKYKSYNLSGDAMGMSDVSPPIIIGVLPETPMGVRAQAMDNNSIVLNWIKTPTANSYSILRGTSQGGPYSEIAMVTAPTTSYTDSTVTPTNIYYYVIQSLNIRGVKSNYSAEVGVNLNGGPTNLISSNIDSGIQLDWDLLAGAVSYNIARSKESGGPYGIVNTAVSNTFIDTSALAGVDYFYVVFGNFAGGTISPLSNEESINREGTLDLQVPIEMIDTRLASSSSGSIAFERTQTSLNTQDYDGVTSYQFEVIGKNSDSNPVQVFIVDEGGIEIGSVTLPANTIDFTRISAVFTPNVGANRYRVKVGVTTVNSQLQVVAARVLVNQSNATKTKLYFPLLSVSQIPSSNDLNISALTTSNNIYETPKSSLLFLREVNDLKKLIDYNAWELEALVSASNSAEGSISLINKNSGLPVWGSETRFNQSAISMASVPIDEGVNQFGLVNEGDSYEINLKCEYNCGLGDVSIYKAGLWVKLENLSKTISFYRNASMQEALGSNSILASDRNLIDVGNFTSPIVYFQATVTDDFGSSADVNLLYHGNESGEAGVSSVVGSTISFNNEMKTTIRNSTPLNLISGQRFVTEVLPSGGIVDLLSSAIVIKSSLP